MAADAHDLAARIAAGMPQLQEELGALVVIPGLSEWDFPEHTRAPLPRPGDLAVLRVALE